MSKVRVEINYAGVGQLLKSEEVAAEVKRHADRIAAKCGNGYASDVHNTPSRVVASAYTETTDAARENFSTNSLLKAVST